MRVTRAIVYVSIIGFVVLLFIAEALLFLSPFQYKFACQFQMALREWTGLEAFRLHAWPSESDDQYTGLVRIWDEWGTLRYERPYKDGGRHGLWKEYYEDGTLKSVCEYKNGLPWNGVCHLYEWKAWWAEYRDGKPYNGCMWENDANNVSIDHCYINGAEVSVNEFMAVHKIEEQARDWLSLVDIFSESQKKME
jgi:hypothetical protein